MREADSPEMVLGCLTDSGWLVVIGFAGLFILIFALIIGEALGKLGPYYPPPDDDVEEEEQR